MARHIKEEKEKELGLGERFVSALQIVGNAQKATNRCAVLSAGATTTNQTEWSRDAVYSSREGRGLQQLSWLASVSITTIIAPRLVVHQRCAVVAV